MACFKDDMWWPINFIWSLNKMTHNSVYLFKVWVLIKEIIVCHHSTRMWSLIDRMICLFEIFISCIRYWFLYAKKILWAVYAATIMLLLWVFFNIRSIFWLYPFKFLMIGSNWQIVFLCCLYKWQIDYSYEKEHSQKCGENYVT